MSTLIEPISRFTGHLNTRKITDFKDLVLTLIISLSLSLSLSLSHAKQSLTCCNTTSNSRGWASIIVLNYCRCFKISSIVSFRCCFHSKSSSNVSAVFTTWQSVGTNYLSVRSDCTIPYNDLLTAFFENPHVPSVLSYIHIEVCFCIHLWCVYWIFLAIGNSHPYLIADTCSGWY